MDNHFICSRCQNKTVNSLKYFITVPVCGSDKEERIEENICLYCYFILSNYYKDAVYF